MLHDLWQSVLTAMTSWHQGKLFIEHAVTIEHGTLHVLVGIFAWLVLAILTRRPITSWLPYLWLLAFILWNETVDLWTEQWPDPGMQYGEGAKDVIATMVVPTVLLFAARLRPDLFRQGIRRRRRSTRGR